MTKACVGRARREAGFTLVELLIGLVLSVLVLGAVFQMVFTQNSMYGRQQGLADARQSLRGAGTLLAWELRHVSPEEGDLYAIDEDSVTLRSFDGLGVVCLKRLNNRQYGLHSVTGDIVAGDSVVVYGVNSQRTADDSWRALAVEAAGPPAGLGMNSACTGWTGTVEQAVQVTVSASADTAGMRIGAPVRSFRRRTYRMIQRDGLWWLGMREGDGSYELLTGPLRAGDGLGLRFMDTSGSVTTVPANVSAVEFVLRAQARAARTAGQMPEDSVVMRVELRG